MRAETDDSPADAPVVILLSARHPGLSGRVVPIDIRLGDGVRALVVTGPNTGGKTVTLRTLGLLSLMHQAGLHVPAAAGSRLPIWRDVFADIGDEQSVAQSLSTFSGHLRSIIRIVDAAGPGTLVLLDELGAGTDPTEGSALAQALLDHFMHAGAMVAATTHYAELKAYAHTTEGARNASVEFDLETLSPTYRLSIGLPGGSQAFAIAERLGLPPEIVTDARSRLSEAQRSFEATLAAIKATEGEAGEALDRARAAELRAADALRVADEERRRARRERDEATRAARNEADEILEQLRDTVRDTRRALERETVTASSLDSAVDRAGAIVEQLPDVEDDAAPVAVVVPRQWQLGERARSVSGGWEGRIAALERGGQRATLEAGGMRVTVDVDDLVLAQGPAANDGSGIIGRVGTRRRTPGRCASSTPARSPRRSTCAAPGWTRRSTRWRATSTTRPWPGCRRSRSSTGSARERCAMPCAAMPRTIRAWCPCGRASVARVATARPS